MHASACLITLSSPPYNRHVFLQRSTRWGEFLLQQHGFNSQQVAEKMDKTSFRSGANIKALMVNSTDLEFPYFGTWIIKYIKESAWHNFDTSPLKSFNFFTCKEAKERRCSHIVDKSVKLLFVRFQHHWLQKLHFTDTRILTLWPTQTMCLSSPQPPQHHSSIKCHVIYALQISW